MRVRRQPPASAPAALRRKLLKALAATVLAMRTKPALAAASRPAVPGVVRLSGMVTINGKPAHVGDQVHSGDKIETGRDGQLVVVIEEDAFLLRENTSIEFHFGDTPPLMRVLAGKILSVMSKGKERRVATSAATIGIRGTGFYIEAEAERTYLCTCYGVVEMGPSDFPARETVTTTHHEMPRYIYDRADNAIVHAPVIDHTDAELTMLEGLVGRRPPFSDWGYGDYY